MDSKTNIPSGLLDDEIVCFLADRYHATPSDIVSAYLLQAGVAPECADATAAFRLEENEMEMMRGLTQSHT